MVKKIFLFILIICFLTALIFVVLNTLRSNPKLILKEIKHQIAKTQDIGFATYNNWLWRSGRAFIFEVIYANIFSPGTARMQVLEEVNVENMPAYTIQAIAEPNAFFKKIYDAKMMLSSAVRKDTKLPLWYKEESFTPEENKSKQIIFNLEDNIAERDGMKFKIPKETYDPLSVFFNFLGHEFKIEETATLKLLSKEDIYDFKITPVEFKDNIYKVNGEVFRENRSSAHGAHFKIWVFDDGKVRVPLLVKVNTAGGVIYLRLKELK